MHVPRRLLTTGLLVTLMLGGPALGQDLSAPDRTAIRDVITRQLDAFQRDDGPGAFAFASPGIQSRFGTPDIFLEMVRRLYPPVYRPRDVQFAELLRQGDAIVQEVEIVGPDGEPKLALYEMERGADGAWRISGCTLVRSSRAGA